MPDIVLTTLNAKYIHTAFGLRYLFANLGDLQSRAGLREFDINQRPLEIVEALLALEPQIIGFGVYIWKPPKPPRSSPPSNASGPASRSFSAAPRSVLKRMPRRLFSSPTT